MKSLKAQRTPLEFLMDNIVTPIFVVLCVGAYFVSGTNLNFLLPELFTRISRNTFVVLSLLIPVVAGMGLNFGIVIGAIAAQIAVFWVVYWGFTGFGGLLLCMAICTPLAILFGWLVGKLFNSMKGSEMIGGLILGYCSDGLYQLLFLFVIGGIIPVNNRTLIIDGGVGVRNTIDLLGNLKYSLDNMPMINILDFAFYIVAAVSVLILVFRLVKKRDLQLKRLLVPLVPLALLWGMSWLPPVNSFLQQDRLLLTDAALIAAIGVVAYQVYKLLRIKLVEKQPGLPLKPLLLALLAVALYALTYVPALETAMLAVRLPVLTYICIGSLCLFMPWFLNTKLGQDMRTVGQSRTVAASAGINVDRVRIIAMIMSTVLASYGQLISLQNIGTFSTYGAHTMVGQYAIAALLVGGASVQKANTKQAILGIILFHSLFILAPNAGRELFGNAQLGEYFRVFVAYGVIAVALALHAWQRSGSKKRKSNNKAGGAPAAAAAE